MGYTKDGFQNEQLIYDLATDTHSYDELNGFFYYPKTVHGDEFYNDHIVSKYIEKTIKGNFDYAVTHYKLEIYAKSDDKKNQIYATKQGKEYFAKDLTTGNEYYALDSNGKEKYFQSFDRGSVFAKIGKCFEMYARNEKGIEYYPKLNGTEVYAKHNFDEYYRYSEEDEKEIYARDQNGKFYFAKNKWGDEIYAKDSNLNEYYFDESILAKNASGQQKYATDESNEKILTSVKVNEIKIPLYELDDDENEKYEKDASGNDKCKLLNNFPIYAKTKDGAEKYPLDRDNKPFFLNYNKYDIYAKDKYGSEIYFIGDDSIVFAKYNNTIPFYAKNKSGLSHYPFNVLGVEFTNGDYTLNGRIVYPRDKTKRMMYPKDADQNEYYLFDVKNYRFSIAHSLTLESSFYAKDREGNEFYPPNHYELIFLLKEYAMDKDGYVIYPKDMVNCEVYLENENGTFDYIKDRKIKKYAFGQYPYIIHENYRIEIPLNNLYRSDGSKQIYPFDEYGNEYIPKGMDFISELEYPITIDNFIIIPNDENDNPKYFPNQVYEIKKLLHRTLTNDWDYLTEKKSKRSSVLDKNNFKPNYITKDYSPSSDDSKNSFGMWILVVLLIPIIIAFLWFYFKKN